MATTHDQLRPVVEALRQGDPQTARRLLGPVLLEQPSADAWYLAARLSDDREQQIAHLRQALALDNWHSRADRMLTALEGVKPVPAAALPPEPVFETTTAAGSVPADATANPEAPAWQRALRLRRSLSLRSLLLIGFLLMTTTASFFTLSMAGLLPGGIETITRITGGGDAYREVGGVPIADVPDAIYTLEPHRTQPATTEHTDAIDHGYLHAYTFDAVLDEEIVIYVQFLSVTAADVAANVAVLDPDGVGVNEEICVNLGDQGILEGDSNVTLQCLIDMPGTWEVRVLGIDGDSVGAYFIGVESLTQVAAELDG